MADQPTQTRWPQALTFALVVIVAFAAWTRFHDLGSRPFHHDESLHAKFSYDYLHSGTYRYDPVYHGPLLYHATAVAFWLFGDTDASARLFPAVCGLLLILLVLEAHRELGRRAVLIGAAMVALSPTLWYYSRFLRNDLPVALFSWVMVLYGWRYLSHRRSKDLKIAALALALSFASKENTYITGFIIATYLAMVVLLQVIGRRRGRSGEDRPSPGEGVRAWLAGSGPDLVGALALFLIVYVLLFSSMLTHPRGVWDGITGLSYWLGQQKEPRIPGPWFYHVPILVVYELPALVFALFALIAPLRRDPLRLFLGYWTVLSFGMYAWANEKVPWLAVHIVLPMTLLAACQAADAWERAGQGGRRLLALAAVLAAAFYLHAGWALNFQRGADPSELMVFVQTSDDMVRVRDEIDEWAYRVGTKKETKVVVHTIAAWPFSWYLRQYRAVSWPGKIEYAEAPLVLVKQSDMGNLDVSFHEEYVERRYPLRAWWVPDWSKLTWKAAWRYVMYRETFSPTGSEDVVFAVRRDLYPGPSTTGRPAATEPQGGARADEGERVPQGHLELDWMVGEKGAGPEQFNEPRDVEVGPQGWVYVADTGNHRIVVLDERGGILRTMGGAGDQPGRFNSPHGIALAPDGGVLVADTWNNRIQLLDAQGVVQWVQGPLIASGQPNYYGPRDVAVGPAGRIYVSDTGNRKIHVLDLKGSYLRSIGGAGKSAGRFIEAVGLAVSDADGGTLYVADTGNRRIQVLSLEGRYRREFPLRGWQEYYSEPYLALDSGRGVLVASDSKNDRLMVYTTRGRFARYLTGQGTPAGAFDNPVGVAVDAEGGLVVADTGRHRILRFKPGW